MYSYNPQQDGWDNELSIGGVNGGGLSRGSACGFGIFDKGYICTGQGDNTDFLKDMWEYDPLLDVWTQKADFPGTARRGAVSFVIAGVAYIGTGEDASGLRKDFYKYDPIANVWGNVADFGGTPRRQAVGFALGNQGYVGTGDDGVMKNDFWQYLVFQNMWVQKANFPGTPRAGATGWGNFPSGFIATGEDINYNYTNDVWEYNYFTNQWIQRASLPGGGRKHATSFLIGNVAYIATGYNGDFLDDCFAYYGIVGMQETSRQSEISLYPNPATVAFSIRTSSRIEDNQALHFYDAQGREVSDAFGVTSKDMQYDVGVLSAKPGVYWYAMIGEAGSTIASASFVIR